MGKKIHKSEYNDFLDSDKLRDKTHVETTRSVYPLQQADTLTLSTASVQTHAKSRKKNSPKIKKPPLTHFLCLPLVNESSRPRLEISILNLQNHAHDTGTLPLKAIRPVGTLHLTLGVMSLDDAQVQAATKYLDDLDLGAILYNVRAQQTKDSAIPAISIEKPSLSVNLSSLVPMQSSRNTSILYAEPWDPSHLLLPFAKYLKGEFEKAGFMVEEERLLRLHATIINTIYAKPRARKGQSGTKPQTHEAKNTNASSARSAPDTEPKDDNVVESMIAMDAGSGLALSLGHGPNAKNSSRFDATDLIAEYRGFCWATEVLIDRVQICRMGAKKVLGDDGTVIDEKYEVVAEKLI